MNFDVPFGFLVLFGGDPDPQKGGDPVFPLWLPFKKTPTSEYQLHNRPTHALGHFAQGCSD